MIDDTEMAETRSDYDETGALTRLARMEGETAHAHIFHYDVTGRLVRRLESGLRPAGWHSVSWNRTDRDGRRATAGVYFIQLRAGNRETSRKVVVLD